MHVGLQLQLETFFKSYLKVKKGRFQTSWDSGMISLLGISQYWSLSLSSQVRLGRQEDVLLFPFLLCMNKVVSSHIAIIS